MLLFKLDKN